MAIISPRYGILPLECQPVENVTFESSKGDYVRCPFGRGQRKRDVEGHPVPNKVEAVDQDGVPGEFPMIDFGSAISRSYLMVSAMISRPSSPKRSIKPSI